MCSVWIPGKLFNDYRWDIDNVSVPLNAYSGEVYVKPYLVSCDVVECFEFLRNNSAPCDLQAIDGISYMVTRDDAQQLCLEQGLEKLNQRIRSTMKITLIVNIMVDDTEVFRYTAEE